jgi:hypothetical protein
VALRARLVAVPDQQLVFPDWPCPTGDCRYVFEFRNEGPDCATTVGGTLKLFKADGTTEVGADGWALDASRRVQPQETVRVEDGTLPYGVVNGLEGKFSITFEFQAVRCL